MREEKVVLCKRLDRVGLKQFWAEVDALFQDGFRFDSEETAIRKMPVCRGVLRVTLVRGEEEVVEKEDNVKEEDAAKESPKEELDEKVEEKEVQLHSLTKKKELLAYAEKHDVIIPDEDKFKFPANIKKYIKEVLDGRS